LLYICYILLYISRLWYFIIA